MTRAINAAVDALKRLEVINQLGVLSINTRDWWNEYKYHTEIAKYEKLPRPFTEGEIRVWHIKCGWQFEFIDSAGVSHLYDISAFQTATLARQARNKFMERWNVKKSLEKA